MQREQFSLGVSTRFLWEFKEKRARSFLGIHKGLKEEAGGSWQGSHPPPTTSPRGSSFSPISQFPGGLPWQQEAQKAVELRHRGACPACLRPTPPPLLQPCPNPQPVVQPRPGLPPPPLAYSGAPGRCGGTDRRTRAMDAAVVTFFTF